MTTESTQITNSPHEKPGYVDPMNDAYDQYNSDHWARHLMLYVKDPADLDNIMVGLSDDFHITVIPDEIIRTQFPHNYYPVAGLLGWCPIMMTPSVQLARSRMVTNILAKIKHFWPHLEITIAEEYVQIQRNGVFAREYPVAFQHNSKG